MIPEQIAALQLIWLIILFMTGLVVCLGLVMVMEKVSQALDWLLNGGR